MSSTYEQQTPTVTSVGVLLFLRNAVTSSSLVAFLYCLNNLSARRARCAPNKHYEIPFVRGMPCSSLYHIWIKTVISLHSEIRLRP